MNTEDKHKSKNTSNTGEISTGLMLGGAVLLIAASRFRAVLALPLGIMGAIAAAGGASMRPEANSAVSSMTTQDQMWVKMKSSVSVMRPAPELYSFWRNPENWPKFMPDIDVLPLGQDRYEVTKRLGPGMVLRQEIWISEEIPNQKVAWYSLGDELPHRGSVEFSRNGGTYVTLTWEYKFASAPVVNLLGKRMIRRMNEILLVKLQRFKQIMEGGGATTFGATSNKKSAAGMFWELIKSDAGRAIDDLTTPATSDTQ